MDPNLEIFYYAIGQIFAVVTGQILNKSIHLVTLSGGQFLKTFSLLFKSSDTIFPVQNFGQNLSVKYGSVTDWSQPHIPLMKGVRLTTWL